MVGAVLHPSYKTCAESPITSRERIEVLLVKAWSNFPFFSYRLWFEYQRHETSVPQKHTLSYTFTPLSLSVPPLSLSLSLSLALKYITQNQDAFLQEFFYRNRWLWPRFWLTIWRHLFFLIFYQRAFKHLYTVQSVQLTGVKVPLWIHSRRKPLYIKRRSLQ